jgi:TetR/AcrR family transcriptional regulator, mexJK operon transcriptional repressor
MARHDAFITAATEVFLERGFANATLDEVIRRSGGSRATLYTRFGSKEGLFAAIIDAKRGQILAALETMSVSGSVEAVLKSFATVYMRELMAPESLALYRVVIAESGRFPELGTSVFHAGPEAAARQVAAYLQSQVEAGRLRLVDTDGAARQFLQIVKGDLHERALMQAGAVATKKEIDRCIDSAIALFLKGAIRT